MKKLKVLKFIVDVFWVLLIPVTFLILFGTVAMFFINEQGSIKILGLNFKPASSFIGNVFKVIFMVSYFLIFLSIHNFRKVVYKFSMKHIFTKSVIENIKYTGFFLTLAGVLMLFTRLGFTIFSEDKRGFGFGYLIHFLCICFGLFFLVLSEIFNISKNLKEENDLTI